MFGTASRSAIILLVLVVLSCASTARGADTLCDPSETNCRTQLLTLIQNENIGIDLGFWFMQDSRYMTEIVRRWQAGVPVRIIMDPRASATSKERGAVPDIPAPAASAVPPRLGLVEWNRFAEVVRGWTV